jgi:putative pyruvate formate lyase activating enzyme
MCGVNRLRGEKGYCKSGKELTISSINPHFGEEKPLVGTHGSGTVFLTGCNLGCIYCQNYQISHYRIGNRMSAQKLAENLLSLQKIGCHNINFVTPTHFVPQLTEAIRIACEKGLRIPIVYNCGGYESEETIRLLDGIIDIYMPDVKYSDSENSKRYSNAPDYFERCRSAVKEMHSQVGDLKINEKGIAERGLLVRHLVLPNDIAGSEKVLRFIAEISENTYLNIMDQYTPLYKAYEYKELSRRPTMEEYTRVVDKAKELGLHRGESFRHPFLWR